MLDLKVYHYSPVNLCCNVARSKECLCGVLGVIHTHQSRNWCQIFLQLLKFEQVLVKGGIGPGPHSQPKLQLRILSPVSLPPVILRRRILEWSALIWQNGNSEQNMQLAKTIKNIFHYESFGKTFEHTEHIIPAVEGRNISQYLSLNFTVIFGFGKNLFPSSFSMKIDPQRMSPFLASLPVQRRSLRCC